MDLREYLDMDDNEQDLLFKEMSKVLIMETLTSEYVYSLIFNEFADIGINIKDLDCGYDIEEKFFFCNLLINKNDVNLHILIENLFLYSAITTSEYLLLKDTFQNNLEIQEYMYLKITKKYNEVATVTILLDIQNPNVQYILETTIDSLLDSILFKVNHQIDDTHRDLEISRIFVFKRYEAEHDIDLLYNEINKGGEISNV